MSTQSTNEWQLHSTDVDTRALISLYKQNCELLPFSFAASEHKTQTEYYIYIKQWWLTVYLTWHSGCNLQIALKWKLLEVTIYSVLIHDWVYYHLVKAKAKAKTFFFLFVFYNDKREKIVHIFVSFCVCATTDRDPSAGSCQKSMLEVPSLCTVCIAYLASILVRELFSEGTRTGRKIGFVVYFGLCWCHRCV